MKRTLLAVLLATIVGLAQAQCPMTNTAFSDNESLTYSLHFNWKFIWLRAGDATMSTKRTTWLGKDCYQGDLITHTNKKLDKFFAMRDTLMGIITPDMIPLYYRKAANEGGKYYVDQVWYDYSNGKTHLKQHYLNRKGIGRDTTHVSKECVYDMMTMMLYARSLNGEGFKKGDKIVFPMADGRKVETTTLVYRGKRNFTTEDSRTTYRCRVFSLVEYENKKEKEIITFYVTDDANHIPVRIDMFLRFGTAKAFLTEAKGLKNPSTSIVKE